MNCPKCNGKIIDGCCIKCGYLSNGNKIKNVEIDKNEDIKLFNKDFEVISQNKNLLLIFILGPLYFSYRGYFFIGIILGIVDCLLFYYLMNISEILVFIFGSFQIFMIYFSINRLIYIIFSNYVCILIDKFKIKSIKKKYKECYKEKLKQYKHNKFYLLLTLLIYVMLICGIIMIKRLKTGLL